MKPTFILIVSILFCSVETMSQAFLPAYLPAFGYEKGYIQMMDGSKMEGTFQSIFNIENIKSVTLKDASGTKHKIGEDQIDKVYIKFGDLDKIATSNTAATSIKSLSNTNFKQVFEAEYFIWEHTITPKKGNREILQLVNPGFDSKMKVYRDPRAQETGQLSLGGVTLTGGIEKSYYLVKQGADVAVRLEKKNYKEQFAEVFGDCPAVISAFGDKKPDWDDLPAHVFAYDQLCDAK